MNKGIIFGLDLNLPFFKNALLVVIKANDAQANDIISKFESLKSLITMLSPESEKIFKWLVCRKR